MDSCRDIFGFKPLVENAFWLDEEDRPSFAETIAARRDDLDLILKIEALDFFFQSVLDWKGSAGDASCSRTY